MADAIERALAELDRHLSRLDPAARKELLGEAAHHLEDLRTAHNGDAAAAAQEFGDPRKLSVQMLRAFGPRRSRALATLTFMGPMVLVAGFVANGYGVPFEFVWFIPPLLVAFAIVALRTRRFAWREIGVGALAGAFATWLFLASATIDFGEKDGYGLLFAPTAQAAMARTRTVQATGNDWLPRLKTMQRAYAKGDTESLTLLHGPGGYLVPSQPSQSLDSALAAAQDLPTTRAPNLVKAKLAWRTTGVWTLNFTRRATEDARRALLEYSAAGTLASRFVPQLVGYLPSAAQTIAFSFGIGAGIHLLMLGLRFVVEALWRRLRPGVPA